MNEKHDFRDVLPDWLPPAMVKDWRQMLRSPLYLLGVLACALLGGMVLLHAAEGEDAFAPFRYYDKFLMLGAVLLCGVVPARVSLAVAAEVRVAAVNFVRLTPLSSRQVVWGTWLSGMAQALLLVLCALPLVGMCLCQVPSESLGGAVVLHGVMLALLLAQAGAMIAAAQATAMLPPLARVVGAFVTFMMVWLVPLDVVRELMAGAAAGWWRVLLHVLACAVLTLTLLEEARRHYAHPAENCAASARVCSLLALLVYGVLLVCCAGGVLEVAWQAYVWAVVLMAAVAVWDMLHPEGCARGGAKAVRWLPGVLQQPGMWGGALWFTAAVLLCYVAVVPLVCLQHEQLQVAGDSVMTARALPLMGVPELLLVFGYNLLDVLVALLAALLLSSLFPNQRTVAFLGVLVVELVAWGMLGVASSLGFADVSLVSLLPLLQPDGIFGLEDCFRTTDWTPERTVDLYGLLGVKAAWLVLFLGLFRMRRGSR